MRSLSLLLVCGWSVFVVVACSPETDTSSATPAKAPSTKQAVKAPEAPKAPAIAPTTTPSVKKPIVSKIAPEGKGPFVKTPDVTSKMTVKDIDWVAVEKHAKLEKKMVPEALKATFDKVPVPVLLPALPEMIKTAKVTRGPHWYAASMDDGAHTLYVQGARTSFEFGQIELSKKGDKAAKKPYLITRTHNIVTISFERFGAGYGIDIECKKPTKDARCNKDDYAHKLMNILGVAGGQK